MSEQEKQAAIAKVEAQGCRRWMTLIILAPIFILIILTLLGPIITENLARQQANEQCETLVDTVEAVPNSTTFELDNFSGEAVITADNLADMVLFEGEVDLGVSIASRDTVPAVNHPDADYAIYSDYQSGEGLNYYICDNTGEAAGAFTAGANAGDLIFNADASLFALTIAPGKIRLFDGVDIRELETITVRDNQEFRQIDSIAFHPTEALLFFTSEDELFIYELENYSELLRLPMFETNNREIGFNTDGTLFFMSETGEEALSYIWSVRE